MTKLYKYLNVNLTIKQISEHTGIPVQTLYYHSRGDDNALSEYITNRINKHKRELLRVKPVLSATPRAIVAEKVPNYIGYFIHTVGIITLLYAILWMKN